MFVNGVDKISLDVLMKKLIALYGAGGIHEIAPFNSNKEVDLYREYRNLVVRPWTTSSTPPPK